jgi:hypothetical protein
MECAPKVRFATDSSLEGTRFELLVPLASSTSETPAPLPFA